MEKQQNKRLVLAIFFLILPLLLLLSCNTAHRAERKMMWAKSRQPVIVAHNCADWYPPAVFDSVRTEYREGAVQWRYDTVTTECPPGYGTIAPVILRTPCPPCSGGRVDTVFKEHIRQVENTARISQLQGELKQANSRADSAEAGQSIWRYVALFLAACWLIFILIKVIF